MSKYRLMAPSKCQIPHERINLGIPAAGDGGRKEGLRLRAEEVRQGEEEEGVAAHLSAASV